MNQELNSALNTALDFEKKGRKIYEEAAANTQNKIVEKTFSYLARQEEFHIKEIENYIKRQNVEFLGDRPEETQKFFTMTISEFKHKTKISEDDLKAHEAALDLEKSSYKFYLGQYNKAKDPELKQFLEFIMKQEQIHYELVKRAYEFIKDPAAFYSKEEEWIFEGW